MPAFDWASFEEADPDQIDDNDADHWIDQFKLLNIEKEEDAKKLQRLLQFSILLTEVKATQADVALEEAQSYAAERGSIDKEREQELTSEIVKLQDQIAVFKKHSMKQEQPSKDGSLLKDEINELRETNKDLLKALKERDRELADEKQSSDRLLLQNESLEKDVRDYKKERDRLQEDLREYQRQLDTTKDTLSVRRNEDDDLHKKIREKNQKILQLISENQNFAEINEGISNEKNRLEASLKESILQMEMTTDQYIKLREALEESDMAIEILDNDNRKLKSELQDILNTETHQKPVEDEQNFDTTILLAVEQKIEQWKTLLQDKEHELQAYKQQNENLKEEIVKYTIETDRANIVNLTKTLEEKNEQIRRLKTELEKTTQEMLKTTNLIEELNDQLNLGGSTTQNQRKRMQELQKRLKEVEAESIDTKARARNAESAALEKDTQLADLLNQLNLYEKGEYGLDKAIEEIKYWKHQMKIRDKELEDRTQHINKVELKVNELLDENEEYRNQLGHKKKDISDLDLRTMKRVEKENDKAMLIVLKEEVTKLEEERIRLRDEIRRLAQNTGQRAVALGLGADDLIKLNSYTEKLRETNEVDNVQLQDEAVSVDPADTYERLTSNLKNQTKVIDEVHRNSSTLKSKLNQLESENIRLTEIMKKLSENSSSGNMSNEAQESIDKLISMLEMKQITGNADINLQLKSKVDFLFGRNHELRQEFNNLQAEYETKLLDNSKNNEKICELQNKLDKAIQISQSVQLSAVSLPDGIQPSSKMIILSLNEAIVQTLHELELKKKQDGGLVNTLNEYKTKLAVMKSKQSAVYEEFLKNSKSNEQELTALRNQLEITNSESEIMNVKTQEYERFLDTIGSEESELRRKVAETTRRMILLGITSKKQARQIKSLNGKCQQLNEVIYRNTSSLKERDIQFSTYCNQLRKERDLANYRLQALFLEIQETVSVQSYNDLKHQYDDLTIKYRSSMQTENVTVQLHQTVSLYQDRIAILEQENSNLNNQVKATNNVESNNDLEFASTGEQRFQAEQTKSEQLQNLYEKQSELLKATNDRMIESERSRTELIQMNITLEKSCNESEEKLQHFGSIEGFQKMKSDLKNLEENKIVMNSEIHALKEILDISVDQNSRCESDLKKLRAESEMLNELVCCFETESDIKLKLGSVHKELIHLKLTDLDRDIQTRVESDKVKKLLNENKKILANFTNQSQYVHKIKTFYTARIRVLVSQLQSIQNKYKGAVPLNEIDKFMQQIKQLNLEKQKMTIDMKNFDEKETELKLALKEQSIKTETLSKLHEALANRQGADLITTWAKKLEDSRIKESKLHMKVEKLTSRANRIDNEKDGLEKGLLEANEKNIALETDAERLKVELQLMHISYFDAKEQLDAVEQVTSQEQLWLPSSSSSIHEQLQEAVDFIFNLNRTSAHQVKTIKSLETQLGHLTERLKTLELEDARKAKLLDGMKQHRRLQQSFETDSGISIAATSTTNSSEEFLLESVKNLRERLNHKDNTIAKYQQLFDNVESGMKVEREDYEMKLQELRELNEKEEERLVEQKRSTASQLHGTLDPVERDDPVQIKTLAGLEQLVAEYESTIWELTDQLKGHSKWDQSLLSRSQLSLKQKRDIATSPTIFVDHEPDHHEPGEKLNESIASRTSMKSKHSAYSSVARNIDIDKDVDQATAANTGRSEKSISFADNDDDIDALSESILRAVTPSTVIEVPLGDHLKKARNKDNSFVFEDSSREKQLYLQTKTKLDRCTQKSKKLEKENQALVTALNQLKQEFVTRKPEPVATKTSQITKDQIKSLKGEMVEIKSKNISLVKDNGKLDGQLTKLKQENESFIKTIEWKSVEIKKLQTKQSRMESEKEQLEKKVSLLRENKFHDTETKEMKDKIKTLEETLRLQQKSDVPEKPFETNPSPTTGKQTDHWWERKKLLSHTEKLKQELDLVRTEKNEKSSLVIRLRESVSRQEKEKLSILKELNQLKAQAVKYQEKSTEKSTSREDEAAVAYLQEQNREQAEQIYNLRKSIEKLEDNNSSLRSKLQSNSKIEKLALNSEEVIEDNELQIENVNDDDDVDFSLFDVRGKGEEELREMVMSLRGIVRQIQTLRRTQRQSAPNTTENDSSAFQEILQAKLKEIGYMKERFTLLEAENKELRQEIDDGYEKQNSTGTIATVNRLHSLVIQLEEEKLELQEKLADRKLSGFGPNNDDIANIVQENKELKEKLTRTMPRVAWTEEFNFLSRSQAAIKLASENERLTREMEKLNSENEQLRNSLALEKTQKNQLQDEVKRLENLSINKRRWRPQFEGNLYEEKLRTKENAFIKIEERMNQLEMIVKQEVENKQKLMVENRRLQQKMQVIVWKPHSHENEQQIIAQTRILKERLLELEQHNEGQQQELEVIRSCLRKNYQEQDISVVTERLKNYEMVLRENIDLKLDINRFQTCKCNH